MLTALGRLMMSIVDTLTSLVGLWMATTVVVAAALAVCNGMGLIGSGLPTWALVIATSAALFIVIHAARTRDISFLYAWLMILGIVALVGAVTWMMGAASIELEPASVPGSALDNASHNLSYAAQSLPTVVGWVLIAFTVLFGVLAARESLMPRSAPVGQDIGRK